jgi:hypothetical protein
VARPGARGPACRAPRRIFSSFWFLPRAGPRGGRGVAGATDPTVLVWTWRGGPSDADLPQDHSSEPGSLPIIIGF